MHIVFLDIDSVDCGDLDRSDLQRMGCVFYPSTKPEQVVERLMQADIVITNKVGMDAPLLQAAPKLKLICVCATGTNNIDLVRAQTLGIQVDNITQYCTESVAQHVFSLILALNTRLLDYHRDVRAGMWSSSDQFCRLDYPITQLAGKVMGIVGYGVLGQAVAHLADAFGMSVLIAEALTCAPASGRTPLTTVLTQADVVSIHCPLSDQSRNLIGADELAMMKSSALLINTARGGIVHEQALADALRHHHIRGAGFDVLSQEPPPVDHPLLAQDLDNLLLTPHTAWASHQARQNALDAVGCNIRRFLQLDDT